MVANFYDLAMGQRVTLAGVWGQWVRCRLAGRIADGTYLFSGGDLGGSVVRLMPVESGYAVQSLDWFDDAELVELTVAG